MQRTYAIAEMRWPVDFGRTLDIKRICTPAKFENDSPKSWSLFVRFSQPVKPGETITVPVTLLVDEEADRLLLPDAKFQLFLKAKLFAPGRIVEVFQVSDCELHCIFDVS